MQKDDLIRLRHMLDAAREALSFSANKTRNDLYSDRMLALSVIKSIEIIGEAASTAYCCNRKRNLTGNRAIKDGSICPAYRKLTTLERC